LYESRLESLLWQYLEARKIKDLDQLINLLISDRIKTELSEHCLKHVIILESVAGDGSWIEPKQLASIVDEYVTNMGPTSRPTSSFLGQPNESRHTSVPTATVKTDKSSTEDKGLSGNYKPRFNNAQWKPGGGRACFTCGSHSHVKANCDKKSTNSVKQINQTSVQRSTRV